MTDEELDRARADEARRRYDATVGHYATDDIRVGGNETTCMVAARLAREGWTPPDPLEAEIDRILAHDLVFWGLSSRKYLRQAMERGIELGREKSR